MNGGSATPKRRWQARLILLSLVVLFVGPIVAAWVLYTHPGVWRPGKTTNYGELITPTRPLDVSAMQRLDGAPLGPDFLLGKWTLLYIGGSECGIQCRDTLYALRQIRLAQGKDVARVQRLYVMTDSKREDQLKPLLKLYSHMAVATASSGALREFMAPFRSPDAGGIMQRVYLVDPEGNLMMRYRRDADPKGILRDLRHVLNLANGMM